MSTLLLTIVLDSAKMLTIVLDCVRILDKFLSFANMKEETVRGEAEKLD